MSETVQTPVTAEEQKPADRKPHRVTDLGELEALGREPFTVEVSVRGTPFSFEGRRLVPAESAEIQGLLESALPPLLPAGAGETEGRYDFQDAGYRTRREAARRCGRAVALWRAYSVFRSKAEEEFKGKKAEEGGTDPAQWSASEITAWMERRPLDDDLLETLFRGVTQGVVGAEAYLGFSSGSNSQPS